MSELIKILIITDTRITSIGGSENHIRLLISLLPKSHYKIYIAELMGSNPSNKKNDISLKIDKQYEKKYLFDVKKIYGINAIRTFFKLHKEIRKNKIDIVLSFHEKSDIINSILRTIIGNKVIAVSSRRDMGICPSKLLLMLRAILVKKIDYVVAPAQNIIDHVITNEKVEKKKTKVIRNGIEVKPSLSNDLNVIKEIEEITSGDVCGVCVANLKNVKGHKYIVDAISIVRLKCPNIKVLFVGYDYGEKDILTKRINELQVSTNIIFLGRREDVPAILQCCDFMISASLSEGLSNALLEGLAYGLPIIASNVGGNSEVVDHNINGFLFESGDVTSLANCILKLATQASLCKIFSVNAREKAFKEFSKEIVYQQYINFFNEIIKKK